jgi:hypothetical protein
MPRSFALPPVPGEVRRGVYFRQLIHTTVLGKAKRIGAKGVCLNDSLLRPEVFHVYAFDQVGCES